MCTVIWLGVCFICCGPLIHSHVVYWSTWVESLMRALTCRQPITHFALPRVSNKPGERGSTSLSGPNNTLLSFLIQYNEWCWLQAGSTHEMTWLKCQITHFFHSMCWVKKKTKTITIIIIKNRLKSKMSWYSFQQKNVSGTFQQNNKSQMNGCLKMSLKAFNQQHNAGWTWLNCLKLKKRHNWKNVTPNFEEHY